MSKTNSRLPNPVVSEKKLFSLFSFEKIGQKNRSNRKDIFDSKVVPNDFIVLDKEDNFIVYNGESNSVQSREGNDPIEKLMEVMKLFLRGED